MMERNVLFLLLGMRRVFRAIFGTAALFFCRFAGTKLMNAHNVAASRSSIWLIALVAVLSFDCAHAAGDGTLVLFRNPTNSAPRVVSTWGGAEMQIILKSDGTGWDWGFNGSGQLGNGTTNSS